MASATENRSINLYINNKQAGRSITEIQAKYNKLNLEIRRGKFTQEEYNAKVKELRQYGAVLDQHRDKIRGVSKSWSTLKSVAVGVIGGNVLLTAFQKITQFIPQMIQRNAQLADSYADVRKTTGLTEHGVEQLNTQLKAIDTRTPRARLLELARDAGKLGITGVNSIAGFVKAADQIDVALGEDLGEGAIKQLGKLNNLFKASETYGYEVGLQKIGSVINELGANSEASEAAIVDFTSRLAGVATQADISFESIAGYGATLDSLGQRVETSGTAVSQAIVGMFKDTSTYAKIAGKSLEDFSQIMEKDANEAFILFLEGLNGNNDGLTEMTTRFDQLGLDGSRAITVLGALAGNTEKLREQQTLANKAFADGTSLTAEFAIKNNNAAGALDKLSKRIRGLWVNSDIQNAVGKVLVWMEKITRVPVADTIMKQRIATDGLITSIMKLNVGSQERIDKINQLKKEYPALAGHLAAETTTNRELLSVMKDINQEYLRKILLANRQDDLQDSGNDLADALRAQDAALIQVNAAREKLLEGANDRVQLLFRENEENIIESYRKVQATNASHMDKVMFFNQKMQEAGIGVLDQSQLLRLNERIKEYEGLTKKVEKANNEYAAIMAQIDRITSQAKTAAPIKTGDGTVVDPEDPSSPGVTAVAETDDPLKAQLDAIKRAADEERLYLEQHRAQSLIDEEQYQSEMLGIKLSYLLLQKEAVERTGGDTLDIDREIAQTEIELMEMVNRARERAAAIADKADRAIEDSAEKRAEAEYQAALVAAESAAWRAASAMDAAETEHEAAVAMINIIRDLIKEYVLQAVIAAVSKEVASKGIIGVITGAVAAGVVSMMFNKLIPPVKTPNKPEFAEGTTYFGGSAIVGDQGREQVNLPLGSQVVPAFETQMMLAANHFGKAIATPNFSRVNEGLTYSQGIQAQSGMVSSTGSVDFAPMIAEIRAMRADLQAAQDKDVKFSYREYLRFKEDVERSENNVIFKQ